MEALIEAHAIELKLPTVRRRFRTLAAEATREQQTPVAYLAALLEAEMSERAERRERRRLIDARSPQIKRLEDFRFADNPNVPQATIAALAEGSWIDDRESVIFIGDSGTGKTMLATALAVCACHQGRRVRFTTLAGLANELQEAQGSRELARVVGRYARTELVVLDELGYLALPDGAAELVWAPGQTTGTRRKAVVIQATPKRRDAGVESLRWYSRAAGLSSTCVRTRVREASANPNRRLRWVRGCHHDFVAACSHLDSVERLELPELVAGCEECLAVGARWVHLRMCQTCGHIGCCDNSPGRHATGHHAASGHPVIRSAEPGEDWSWCYVDELMFRLRPS